MPAELVFTLLASHMVAASVLDNHDSTLGTVLASFAFLPKLKLSIFVTLAADMGWISNFTTVHAYESTTLTLYLIFVLLI